jgi:hypothetical protein
MKVKNDFVTNSSSCSYIVCIPNMKKFLEKLESKIEISEEARDLFLDSGEFIYFGEEFDYDEFQKIHDVVEELGYVLGYNERGPENSPEYINVVGNISLIKQVKKILGEE